MGTGPRRDGADARRHHYSRTADAGRCHRRSSQIEEADSCCRFSRACRRGNTAEHHCSAVGGVHIAVSYRWSGAIPRPTLAAVTMGMVGVTFFDRQFGKNQSFNSAGNVACALLIAAISHVFGNRAIFITAAVLTIPTVLAVRAIRSKDIDYDLARGGAIQSDGKEVAARVSVMKTLLGDRILLVFLACAFLFHFANAAMLPQLGEMLSHGARATAAPFMSACIIVTQVVIMCFAAGYWTLCESAWPEATPAARLRRPSHPRTPLYPHPQHGRPDRDSITRRRGQCNLRSCLDPRRGRQDPGDRPLQSRARQSRHCSRTWRCLQHNLWRKTDSTLQLSHLIPVPGSYRTIRVRPAVVGDSRNSHGKE